MAEDSGQEKTEQPTGRRRDEAKDKGNVAKSTELNAVAVLIAAMLAFKATSGLFGVTIRRFIINTYHESSLMQITVSSLPGQLFGFMKIMAMLVLPFMLLIMFAALASNVGQVGFMIAKKAMMPDFKRINPASGLKAKFSSRSIVELLKGIFKVAILAFISYLVIDKYTPVFMLLSNKTASDIMTILVSVLMELTFKITLALLAMAIADYAYQKYKHEKELKMTKEEVKEENKQDLGNPEIKKRIKGEQMKQAMQRMFQAIPEASVVVTNPTHIAVALKYEPESSADAPKIVAMGKEKIAERIKKIARENNIPVIENKPLARGLFAACEIGMEIPAAFYQAVAEILSKIYQTNKSKMPKLGGVNG